MRGALKLETLKLARVLGLATILKLARALELAGILKVAKNS